MLLRDHLSQSGFAFQLNIIKTRYKLHTCYLSLDIYMYVYGTAVLPL